MAEVLSSAVNQYRTAVKRLKGRTETSLPSLSCSALAVIVESIIQPTFSEKMRRKQPAKMSYRHPVSVKGYHHLYRVKLII